MRIESLFEEMVNRGASDLHLTTGMPPLMRVIGELEVLDDYPPVTETDFMQFIDKLLDEVQKRRFREDMEIDFAFTFDGRYRFRVAFYRHLNGYASALRLIPGEILPLEKLGLPPVVKNFARKENGLVLAVGPTGCGKSTTLASIIDLINSERRCHIITIEDPIEFIHQNKKAYITQRELNTHTRSFASALRSAMREDPDVIMVGEMRDLETIQLALNAAETGHLVLATLHANSAPESVDRIISAFPPDRQSMVRVQLSNTLVGVIYQALIPRVDRKAMVCAAEVMVGTPAVRNIIREEKTYQLPSVMQTGMRDGMQSMEQALRELQMKRLISPSEATKRMRSKISLTQRPAMGGVR
jgi:twitching motility protein PilT